MEMKPDYNYGAYIITDIRLLRKNIGEMPARVLHVLRKLYPQSDYKNLSAKDLLLGKSEDVVISWRLSETQDIAFLKEQFSWAMAELEICETEISLAFNDQEPVLRYALDQRIHDYGSVARLPSEELSRIQEYAFHIWAKENRLLEAYRYFLFPALGQAEVIRVWRTDKSSYGIYKIGDLGFCIKSAARETSFEISPEAWQDFQAFMEKFWQANSWQTHNDVFYVDGATLSLEGWNQGNYKILSASNPNDSQSLALQADKVFRALVPTSN